MSGSVYAVSAIAETVWPVAVSDASATFTVADVLVLAPPASWIVTVGWKVPSSA